MRWSRFSICFMINFALAVVVWAIFFPGTLSSDSLMTYYEALTGRFTDVRPPLITFLLFLFLKFGGGLGTFTLVECLLGFLGARRLLIAASGLFSPTPRAREWTANIGSLILASPLTPMPVYFITLWVDSWLVIFLLWTLALLLELFSEEYKSLGEAGWIKALACLVTIILVILTRWNSLILFPLLIALWCSVLWRRKVSRSVTLALACMPLIAYVLFLAFQYEIVGVKRIHTERFVFALDLASMITYDRAVCRELTLQSCELIEGKITPRFVVGDGAIEHTMNQGRGTIEPAFAYLLVSPFLKDELLAASSHFPLSYISVKALNFLDYVRPRPRYYFQSFIHANNIGLHLNEHFAPARNQYVTWLHWVYMHPVLRLFSFAHITWILTGIVGVLYCWRPNPNSKASILFGFTLLVPLLYVFSYLLALTSSDFRYMYPSTLLLQVLSISFAGGVLGRKIEPWESQS